MYNAASISCSLQLERHAFSLWIKVKKSQIQSEEVSFESEVVTKNLITRINKKTRSNKCGKWRHSRNTVEIAWMKKADFKWIWRHINNDDGYC